MAFAYERQRYGKKHLVQIRENSQVRNQLHQKEDSWKKAAASITMISIIISSAYAISQYKYSQVDQLSENEGYNLTTEKVKWDLYIGKPRRCQDIDCHLKKDYPKSNFNREIILPSREFPLKGYKAGENNLIYYRSQVKIPLEIINSHETIKIHSLFIWAKHYEFYINEKLYETGAEEALFITIPRDEIHPDGTVFLSIKVDPTGLAYQGISNYGNLIIGKKSLLLPKLRITYDIQYRYPLWFLVPRIALCILFCFLYIWLHQNPEHFAFILFSTAGIIKFTFLLDYNSDMLPTAIDNRWAFSLIYPLEQWLLLGFIQKFFRKYDLHFDRIYKAITILLTALFIFGMLTGKLYINSHFLHLLPRIIRLIAITYGFWLAIETTLYLAWSGKSEQRLYSCFSLVFFFVIALFGIGIDIAGILPVHYRGFSNYTIELILFIFFAAITALDFSGVLKQRNTMSAAMDKTVGLKLKDAYLIKGGTLPAEERHISVLFSDIRNFSTLTSALGPKEIQKLLNEYFSLMTEVISKHDGRVDKIIGDAIMAVWGAPDDDQDQEIHAARAAIEMRGALREFNFRRAEQGLLEISIGIGVHCGLAIAAEIGGESRAMYTVIGDEVNIAARLESESKNQKTDILLSEAIYKKIDTISICSPTGPLRLKGIFKEVPAYKLVAMELEGKKMEAYCDIFNKIVEQDSKCRLLPHIPNNLRTFDYTEYESNSSKLLTNL
ncbi:MAG: adenylate/guanylate cyclase domain-containing protein [Bdellovibrionota bacterium]